MNPHIYRDVKTGLNEKSVVFCYDTLNVCGGKSAVNVLVNRKNGCKTASAYATGSGKRELSVGCAFVTADAENLGVSDKEIVKVKVDTARPVIFDDVVVRVSDKFALAMHIDTDECNAAAAFGAVYGEIVK